jgi:hypothetical protein
MGFNCKNDQTNFATEGVAVLIAKTTKKTLRLTGCMGFNCKNDQTNFATEGVAVLIAKTTKKTLRLMGYRV